ncbi:MAG: hypothetical protein RLZZ336_2085 [Cyanobacteriota bacterium]|jgi:hypothetical protein
MLPRLHRIPLVLVVSALIGAQPLMPAVAQTQTDQPAPAQAGAGLSVEQARAAATRILATLQRGDSRARYAQFSPEMQAITSPSMIAATMRSQPPILGFELLSVRSGLSSSTVEAEIDTKLGKRVVFLVLDPQGKIRRYYIDRADDKAGEVARQFAQALSTGNFITAQSFLSPDFQVEITPAVLQSRWQELQQLTGTFVRVGRAVEAERTTDSQLVLVNLVFNRLSDNLFVVLNNDNQITGLDFPEVDVLTSPIR